LAPIKFYSSSEEISPYLPHFLEHTMAPMISLGDNLEHQWLSKNWSS